MPSDSERKAVKATVTPRKVNIPKLARKIAKQMFIDGRGKKCLSGQFMTLFPVSFSLLMLTILQPCRRVFVVFGLALFAEAIGTGALLLVLLTQHLLMHQPKSIDQPRILSSDFPQPLLILKLPTVEGITVLVVMGWLLSVSRM